MQAQRDDLEATLGRLREQETNLRVELAGHGGNRLAEIERQLTDCDAARTPGLAKPNGSPLCWPPRTCPRWKRPSSSPSGAARSLPPGTPPAQDLAGHQNALTETGVRASALPDEAAEVNAELRSLRERKTNIPKKQLELRARCAVNCASGEDALPIAGELIAVRDERGRLGRRRGAAAARLRALGAGARRALRARSSDWINAHHLRDRVVYYRVPELSRAQRGHPSTGAGTLAAKLLVKDTPFAGWLEHELARRADHACVETMAEFRRMPRAITKVGQVKGSGGRHEKDDRFRIDDRSRYVLGWSNQRKLDALLDRAGTLAGRAQRGRGRAAAAREGAGRRGRARPGARRAGPDARVRRDRLAVRGQPGRATPGRAARA